MILAFPLSPRHLLLVLILLAAPASADLPATKPAEQRVLGNLRAPDGFDLTLFAAPPQVNYPTCLTATPNGILFVGIDEQGSLGREPNGGRIVRCIDADGDGRAEQITTFARLDHPRGLVWDDAQRVLYVLHPPLLSRCTDADGDGVAEEVRTLVRGVSNPRVTEERGADHATNGIRMGMDGWIYIAVGDFGIVDAVGSDGRHLKLHGGGIVRVRPDGSGLETFATGMRNIYDVAIDPMLNVFTRDNTNDGDGWNDRLTYSVPGAYHGYPSRFKRFREEIVDCMIDFGSGSPCGVLFVDEPALPQPHRRALYTVEWGLNRVDRHPLTADGAGFAAGTEKLMDLPRGTDIDIDAAGRLYLSSWANGGFRYTDENVGYVIRLSPKGAATTASFPDMRATGEGELLEHLAAPSGVRRQAAQREILRRGDSETMRKGLLALAVSDAPTAPRVAAVFTLKLLCGPAADASLVELSRQEALREFALRALADQEGESTVPARPFVDALRDPDPRVRLIAAWGLARLGRVAEAARIVPLTIDPDPLVAHVAVNSLVQLKASGACLEAVTDHADPTLAAGALEALQQMHEAAVVEGLAERLEGATVPAVRSAIFRALCRLHVRERDWDGTWWGTRPDTTGPYFQPVAWSGTARVAELIRHGLASDAPQVARTLLLDGAANRVDLPEIEERLQAVDPRDSARCGALLDTLIGRTNLSERQIAATEEIARAVSLPAAVRARAIRTLVGDDGNASAIKAAVGVLGSSVAGSNQVAPAELEAVLEAVVQNPRLARHVPLLARLAAAGPAGQREVSFATLLRIADSKLTDAEPRAAAQAAIDSAWEEPAATVALLGAIGRTKSGRFEPEVTKRLGDGDARVADAAAGAAKRLGISSPAAAAATTTTTTKPSVRTIASIGYDESSALVLKIAGDAQRGKALFAQLGCVACHTVSPDEPPRGPFLGGVAARYSRAELCESILDPNARIAQGFETQWFKTKDDVLDGFITREAGDAIELRNLTGNVTVLNKDDVKSRGTRSTSMMPTGLADKLSPEELASLLAYLESLR